jgi:cytochrome c biogenesis protein CcmG/thiol:disulfide interchange protein DsbE
MKPVLPVLLFGGLIVFLAAGLKRDPREIPSPLINKAAPDFRLARLDQPQTRVSSQDLRSKVWLLNVWASWCLSCREEHPVLMSLARSGSVPVYGLDYRDNRNDALDTLSELGNPYVLTLQDAGGRTGIDYGVYGVPETYLIDKSGIIRFKRIGPVTQEILDEKILPLVRELNQ